MKIKIINGMASLTMLVATAASNYALAEAESAKARGGQLYDKWYAVVGASDAPLAVNQKRMGVAQCRYLIERTNFPTAVCASKRIVPLMN